LIIVAAFAAGFLAGFVARPPDRDHARAVPRDAPAPRPHVAAPAEGAGAAATAPRPAEPVRRREAGATDESPDRDQPLERGTEFAEWNGGEFVRWYAVHKEAWDLPDMDETFLATQGEAVLALRRIPRRDILLLILRALEERERALAPIIEEMSAWHAANPGLPNDPAANAFDERLRAAQQQCWDRLHGQLAYSDYRLLVARGSDDVEVRPPPGGPLPGGDPYSHPVEDAREFYRFSAWYHAYRPELGLPERDGDFLEGFHQHVVVPLGRLPQPALMRTLQEAYLPSYPRLRDGMDWEGTVRAFFRRLDEVLGPLDYERMRHSYEWRDDCRELSIPGPTAR
jgi:hypothetical protein